MSEQDYNFAKRTGTPSPDQVSAWLVERYENCSRHAARQTNERDRKGWLEDMLFFKRAIELLGENHQAAARIRELREALSSAPRPETFVRDPDPIAYADWFHKVRGTALRAGGASSNPHGGEG